MDTNAILNIAAHSPIRTYNWHDRGQAPIGYIKGMAMAFATVYAKLGAGDAMAQEMAQAQQADAHHDALTWYAPKFQALGMTNGAAGADTLRHLFVLMVGLGMRESSGRYCEGYDHTVQHPTADNAEAGLFQMSWDAHSTCQFVAPLTRHYTGRTDLADIFAEHTHCSAADVANNVGDGPGRDFQQLTKACPLFAVECAAVSLRHIRTHWGPINRHDAELKTECDDLFRAVQVVVDQG